MQCQKITLGSRRRDFFYAIYADQSHRVVVYELTQWHSQGSETVVGPVVLTRYGNIGWPSRTNKVRKYRLAQSYNQGTKILVGPVVHPR